MDTMPKRRRKAKSTDRAVSGAMATSPWQTIHRDLFQTFVRHLDLQERYALCDQASELTSHIFRVLDAPTRNQPSQDQRVFCLDRVRSLGVDESNKIACLVCWRRD